MIISPNQIVSYCNSSELFIRQNINNATCTDTRYLLFFFFKFVSLALANSKKKREKKGGEEGKKEGGVWSGSVGPPGVCVCGGGVIIKPYTVNLPRGSVPPRVFML